jgi:AcrR family transcriptional regulator
MSKAGTGAVAKRERVPQAERRRITRGKLLDATIESLIDLGYARTTTVEVGERTGLSRGTQLHHFPSKADLLVSAIEHLADERLEDFDAVAEERFSRGDDPVDAMIDVLWVMFSDPIYWATIELMVAARTDPELLEKLEAFERSLGGRIYAAFKKRTGSRGRVAKTSLEMTLYFMRGLAMERIFRQNEAHYTHLITRWKAQLRTLLEP